jgi:tetratricopeptide (TPR) repeat protein
LQFKPEAARLYADGVAKMQIFDYLAARQLLERAVAADPQYPLAHSALGRAWASLGYDANALSEAQIAFRLSEGLPREERLWVEAQYRTRSTEWDKAIEIYKTLVRFFPDNLEYGLALAAAQTQAGRGRDALLTVETLRGLPAPISEDPRIDAEELRAADSLGDFQREKLAADRAAVKGEAHGARLVVAVARSAQCWAFQRLGNPGEARTSCGEAKRIFAAVGDRDSSAWMTNNLGVVEVREGDYAKAEADFKEALSVFHATGNMKRMSATLSNLAAVYMMQGDVDAAASLFKQTFSVSEQVNDRLQAARSLGNLGAVLSEKGDLSQARRTTEESIARFREINNEDGTANGLVDLAEVLFLHGDLAKSKARCEEALALAEHIGEQDIHAAASHTLGEILSAEGASAAAQNAYKEALKIQTAIGEQSGAAKTRSALAEAELDLGDPRSAQALVHDTPAEFHKENDTGSESLAHSLIAWALVEMKRSAEARNEIARAVNLEGRIHDRSIRMKIGIITSRVEFLLGGADEAQKELQAILVEARELGYVGYQFQSRLELARIELQAGQTAASRAHLDKLEKDARAKSFLLIARKAAALAKLN